MTATSPTLPGVTHRICRVNGVGLHVAEAGPPDAPRILLLHGFPEFWWSWRHQIPDLTRDFRVIAPDMRGFNDSDKPAMGPDGAGYDVPTLARDVADLIARTGAGPVVVVGHDWGGVVAWQLAMDRPDLVARLVILNGPHPHAWARGLLDHPEQRVKGWYVFLTLAPGGVSEDLYRQQFATGAVRLARVMRAADVAVYARAFLKPGAATATVSYYRSLMLNVARLRTETPPSVTCPTTVLWGMKDEALEPVLNEIIVPWVPDLTVVPFPDNWHWLATERPDEVTAQIRRAAG